MAPNGGPVARIRARFAEARGPEAASGLPRRYTRYGRLLVVPLPESHRPWFAEIARLYAEELGVESVLRPIGPVAGEFRHPQLERLYGSGTETEVREHGIRYRFDAAEIMFARGNKSERARAGSEVRPGETVYDLFAGIGYFTIPAARSDPTVRVRAVEANPPSFRYLIENLNLNSVAAQVEPLRGDNRRVLLPLHGADRIFLGYLPSSLPWVGRALELVRPEGGTLHLHLVAEVRGGLSGAERKAREAVNRSGGETIEAKVRAVKPFGPGRFHAVVDARVRPG